MFGLSIGKILIVVGVVAAAWWAFRRFGGARTSTPAARPPDAPPPPTEPAAEDLVKCRVCGVYVPSVGAVACGRGDCPQRR